jgi:hypothetical protein
VQALGIRSANDFRQELEDLGNRLSGGPSSQLVMLVYPVLDHFDTFATFFVNMMSKAVDVSMLWGLLFLVIQVRKFELEFQCGN